MPRYFTIEEANQSLEILRPIVAEILELRAYILSRRPELRAVIEKAGYNGGSKLAGEMVFEFKRLEELVRSVHAEGALLKDVNTGLLDFPSLREGRQVYLCWAYGEDQVRFWHDLDAGFAGRQPI